MLEEAIIFLILYAILIFTDLVPVYKENNKKTIIFCTSVFIIAFVLQFLIVFGVELPRYADLFEIIVKSIAGLSGRKII